MSKRLTANEVGKKPERPLTRFAAPLGDFGTYTCPCHPRSLPGSLKMRLTQIFVYEIEGT